MYGLGFQHYEDVRSNVGNVMVALRPYLISRKKVVNTSMGHIAGHFLTFEIIVDNYLYFNMCKHLLNICWDKQSERDLSRSTLLL